MSETRSYQAVLSVSSMTGRWRVFVGVLGTTDPWPEHDFAVTDASSLAARLSALAQLGFEPVEGAEWKWSEDQAGFGAPVELIAGLRVREWTGGAA
ncbi:DUF6303 family protein [Streptomyces sp. NBC_00878]|uniref:DUF6303 family protein n=1 Tax=Streptomyces sp. NBC_00878 TaxID=2975854 RepID=UPI00225BDE0E|nr:DUF6303 family protein [Streptomyces sp. NBC_00878]MCX4906954.1 DUF6303 family protein [Streptomyces sp. NBC_00878]